MFFNKFPKSYFKIGQNESIIVTDFVRAIRLDPELKTNNIYFYEYVAKDGETPEIISHKVYKSTQYHWVIMLLNERYDARNDFPQPETVIRAYTQEKYGSLTGIHHYEDTNGNWVDEFSGGVPITNLEHEQSENERKRIVKILKREVLTDFVAQYQALIGI